MTAPLTLAAYRLATAAAAPTVGAWLAFRLNKGKEDPDRIDERRGVASAQRPEGPLVWLHGASVGETVSLLPLVERLTQGGINALMTSGTLTSARLMGRRLPPRALHQFVPLDAPDFFRRFFSHWRPDLGLVTESEIWPNMIVEAHRARIPLAMINARMSERSYRRWLRLPGMARALIGRFDLVLAQSETDGERFTRLGARWACVVGNLKYDAPAPPAEARQLAALVGSVAGRRLWIAASTHEGEERIAGEAHIALRAKFPDLLTLVAPRHPERGGELAEMFGDMGLNCRLRSRGHWPDRDCAIYICDTMGEFGLFYRLAGIVFVGRSLARGGGQNPIEAAKLACAILHGPEVANFADVYSALDDEGGAFPTRDGQELVAALTILFSDASLQRTMARAAAACVERRTGAVDRTLAALSAQLSRLEPAGTRT